MLPPRKVQFERRISIPQLQVRRALSGGYGGCLCQWELKAPTDRSQSDCVHEQVAKADCECPFYSCRLSGDHMGNIETGFCKKSINSGKAVELKLSLR